MKKIYQVGSNEDGEIFYVVGNVTKMGAIRAFWKEIREWGIEQDIKDWLDGTKISDVIEQRNFWETDGGDGDGYIWWKFPNKETRKRYGCEKVTSLGTGWLIDLR